VEFENFGKSTQFGMPNYRHKMHERQKFPTVEETTKLQDIISKDSLSELASDEKKLLWRYRHTLKANPKALIKILSAVSWCVCCNLCLKLKRRSPAQVNKVHECLERWSPLEQTQSLELLDAKFAGNG
jgi:hypothetical protein